ncbi:MAG: hypothetical protein LUC91_03835, partial [Prevotella sp.]|nr:hypothetical protein [Prevotella sp.]
MNYMNFLKLHTPQTFVRQNGMNRVFVCLLNVNNLIIRWLKQKPFLFYELSEHYSSSKSTYSP